MSLNRGLHSRPSGSTADRWATLGNNQLFYKPNWMRAPMKKQEIGTKAELLTTIEANWNKLTIALNRLTDSQKTAIKDTQGWAVKDHIIHLSVWERSVIYFLQGQPRYKGLDITKDLYENGSGDDINEAIFQQNKEISLTEAAKQLHDIHQKLLQVIQPLTDTDLHKTYRQYLPDEINDDRLTIQVISSNSSGHFAEHLNWIESLVRNVA
jgi:hypothetical protein